MRDSTSMMFFFGVDPRDPNTQSGYVWVVVSDFCRFNLYLRWLNAHEPTDYNVCSSELKPPNQ